MSDAPSFGVRQIGYGPNPKNDSPEPSFESPILAMEGTIAAMRPTLMERERFVSELISRLINRLFRYAFASCLGEKNASLAVMAQELQQKVNAIDDAGLSPNERLTEFALSETSDILAFKQQVYSVRNDGVDGAVASTKLDNAIQEAVRLRIALGYAA